MGILVKKSDKKDASKKSKINKKYSSSIKEGFSILTKEYIESQRSSAYEYVL